VFSLGVFVQGCRLRICKGLCVKDSMVSGASAPWQYSSALQTKHDTYGNAKGYVSIVAGHIHESQKSTHIRKGGRNVQKHI
jgi:hypothetical protein